MKVKTSIRTLKEVYGLFKAAGIAGLMTGAADEVSAVDVMEKLVAGGLMEEVMKVITDSDRYVDEQGIETSWEDVPFAVVQGVLNDFFGGIGGVSRLALR